MRKFVNSTLAVAFSVSVAACGSDQTLTPVIPSVVAPPANPSPANGTTGLNTALTLAWSSTGATSYDVRLGTSSPPPVVSAGQPSASYSPASLRNNTTYSWQIVAHNSAGDAVGPVWSFSTVASLIAVVEASYGKNCNVGAVNNQLAILSNLCNGKNSCDYVLQTNPGGDPCNQVRKDYDWSWTCSTNTSILKRNHLNGEALGSTMQLSCP